MSARLIGEVAEWLRSPAAEGMTAVERCILFGIAERCHESTRVMLRHRTDDEQLVERLARIAGVDREAGLKRAFQRLAKRGLEVRIPLKHGKDGRPVFAFEGQSMRFRLPQFPASVSLPDPTERGDDGPASSVENPGDNPAEETGADAQRGDGASRLSDERGDDGTPSEAERGDGATRVPPRGGTERTPISPSKEHPSKDQQHPSEEHPSSVLSPVAELEGTHARARETGKNDDEDLPAFDFDAAQAFMRSLDPLTDMRLYKQAKNDLGERAKHQEIVIRAAQLGAKDIPA